MSTFAFFTSSVGDTNLALATIRKMKSKSPACNMLIIPITSVSSKRIKDNANDLIEGNRVQMFDLPSILGHKEDVFEEKFNVAKATRINAFLLKQKVSHVYVGVASPVDEELPYQIADALTIPTTIAYEFMFEAPKEHKFWKYIPQLTEKKDCEFAIPLESAAHNFPGAKLNRVGHLSIDQAIHSSVDVLEKTRVRQKLKLNENEELVFISGTTQVIETDSQFLEALLSELNTGQYPSLQLRFGVHPGVKDRETYFSALLDICGKYPNLSEQFKIVLTNPLKEKISIDSHHPNILCCDISGSEMAGAADKVAQAVPGALLNEAALQGKPSYYHNRTVTPYLPKTLFSNTISTFFNATRSSTHSRKELGLKEDCSSLLAQVLQKNLAKLNL